MKVLIVCSGNAPNFKFEINQAFVYDQVTAIEKCYPEVEFEYFFIEGRKIFGYLKNIKKIKKQIHSQRLDIVHAHYAFSGLLANLSRETPVLCTFHGTDINIFKNRIISAIVALLSHKTIFVSKKLFNKAYIKKGQNIIPCGVDFDVFKSLDKESARKTMNLCVKKKYLLFSSAFDNSIKNFKLLHVAQNLLRDDSIEIIELKGYSRNEVALLMNAVDVCIMTSLSEGSPQFIKEALACNCPIVSTDVGDAREIIRDTEGCYITSFDPEDVAAKIKLALDFNKRTNGREKIRHLDNRIIAEKIVEIYKSV